jgi:3-isopropylmalate dehydrogenase
VEQAGGIRLELVDLPIGWEAIDRQRAPVPEQTNQALLSCDGWIMGPHDAASYPPEFRLKRNPSGELRHTFDLYANIRPCRTFPGLPNRSGEADLVIVRENTEGFYSDRNMYAGTGEFKATPDVALVVGTFTRKAAERIAHAAFRLAMGRRKKVTIVHKANVIPLAYGLFLDVCRGVGGEYPDVSVEDYHIDAMAAHLVRRAGDFDVIVTTNMFGDILSDLAGELTGSLGMAPSLNTNGRQAMAQAAHGSAPDIAGQNMANPTGMLLSVAMLLDWLADSRGDGQLRQAARRLEQAVIDTLAGGCRTRDLGGTATTSELTERMVDSLRKQPAGDAAI